MKLKARGTDQWGNGWYLANRGGRKHNGVDIATYYEDPVHALCDGLVTKIGYPYSPAGDKGHFRYVELSDSSGILGRYFYVDPLVEVGQLVKENAIIGSCQNIAKPYPGMVNHYHFEVLMYVRRKKVFLNPNQYISALGHSFDRGKDERVRQ